MLPIFSACKYNGILSLYFLSLFASAKIKFHITCINLKHTHTHTQWHTYRDATQTEIRQKGRQTEKQKDSDTSIFDLNTGKNCSVTHTVAIMQGLNSLPAAFSSVTTTFRSQSSSLAIYLE